MSLPSASQIQLLEFEIFEPLVGADFGLCLEEGGESQTALKLASAKPLGEKNSFGRRPFSLIFEGDPNLAIPQGMFWFQNPNVGKQAIFIVPIGADASCRRYEAIFN